MGLDKKQLPQLIVLGVLVVVCVGYISFKLVAPKPAVPLPAAKPGAQATASTEVGAEGSSAESDAIALLPSGEFPNLSVMPAKRDPFAPQRMPGEEDNRLVLNSRRITSGSGSSIRPVNQMPNPFLDGNNAKKKLPPLGFSGQQPTVPMLPVNPEVKPQDVDPEFVLTGVVRGDENVAIIRVGQAGRYVVKEGQLIDGRYRVKSVTDDGAVLVYKNRSIYLKLGGVTNAS